MLQDGLSITEFCGVKNLRKKIEVTKLKDNTFINSEEEVNLDIPFISEFPAESIKEIQIEKNEVESFVVNPDSIHDVEQNEIISASKISVFNQCPFKYNLVYDLGYTSLFYKGKDNSLSMEYDKEEFEDTSTIPANIQGSIIHKLLEEEIKIEKLEERIEQLVISNFTNISNRELAKVKLDIKQLLLNYINSDTYRKISEYNNYENEFEIYIKHHDFYLYGIIDKIIFDYQSVQIIDYKTDSLKKYSPREKLESYKYQLIFYAYLVSKMKPTTDKFICQLIFIENPNETATIELTKNDINEFEKEMIVGINSMRKKTYKKNISHCKSCYFSDTKYKCII